MRRFETPEQKERRRASQLAYENARNQAAMEIGPLPPVIDSERKERCRNSLKAYCETYRKDTFDKEWGTDHLKVIDKLERVILHGGQYAIAMPRGSGKTSLSIAAAEWAILYGHRKWLCLVGATENKAVGLLKTIKASLRFNPLIGEDFPEAVYPIRALKGQSKRAIGQTLNGLETNIVLDNSTLVFPTIEGSLSSGSSITVAGITGDIRGQQRMLADGSIHRPELVIVDDPQTRESASSATQTKTRLEVLQGDILGLAGPGVKIAAIVPITVVYRGDMADRLMDRGEHPEWDSSRTQMLYGEPDLESLKHWDAYREIRHHELANDGDGSGANAYYAEHSDVMDRGLVAGWPARIAEGELSAIQHAMNLRFRDEDAFLAEYQNQPKDTVKDDSLTARQLLERIGSTQHREVPSEAEKLVAFIDVQKEALFWVICAFGKDYTGTIIDYGAHPEQGTNNFVLSNLRRKLSDVYRGAGFEDMLREALNGCCAEILDRTYRDELGAERSITRCLVDANWGQSRNAIYNWARTCPWRGMVLPSHGKYIGASTEPLNANIGQKPGVLIGTHWRIARTQETGNRYVLYDTNYWKSFVMSRFATVPGRRGSLVLYSARPHVHETFVQHCKAEYPVRTQGRGREVDEWKVQPGAPDNHWWDGLVGCHVAAGIEGCSLGDRPVKINRPSSGPRMKGSVSAL